MNQRRSEMFDANICQNQSIPSQPKIIFKCGFEFSVKICQKCESPIVNLLALRQCDI